MQRRGRALAHLPSVPLLGCGALLGFAPALRAVQLPPEAVLLLFLPALLYWESLTSSLREIRSYLRVIVLMSTVLVLATAGAVAAIGHALGLPWGPAWVLGAAVAPTDATAVSVLARLLPRRTITLLRAESLVNDGTALVIYGLAVGITVGQEHFSTLHVSWLFLLAYAGGAASGLVTAWIAVQVRRRLDNPLQENAVSVLTPFVAFLGAALIGASGVLAVVVCGLVLSQIGPRLVHAATRQQVRAEYEEHLDAVRTSTDDLDLDPRHRAEADYAALRLELLAHKRAAVVRLRDERRIDDAVLRQIQAKIDIEELRLTRRQVVE